MNNLRKKHPFLKSIIITIGILILMWLSFGVGIYLAGENEVIRKLAFQENVYLGKLIGKYEEQVSGNLSQDVNFDLFWDVWQSLEDLYVDQEKVIDKKLFYGAIKGMVASVGDPYTVFMDPKISKEFSDDLAGAFEGIGAEIGIKGDILTIIAPLPGMPAELAGLKAGDKVFAINSESTIGITIDEAVNKIRGEKGTEVVLSIAREEEDGLKDISITRDRIIVHSIRTHMDGDVFVIQITNFNDDTEFLFNEAVREAIDKNPQGIIIDLRNNPGGYLDTAIEIASEWIESDVVVTEKYNEDKKIEHLSRGRARLKDFLTIILVNQGSASASEIVSGALQDYGSGLVIGEMTFGKGSVQTLDKFPDGSSVKITVAKWLTPSGRSISDEGIEPDIKIDYTLDDFNNNRDPQMDKALELLASGNFSEFIATTSEEEIIENNN